MSNLYVSLYDNSLGQFIVIYPFYSRDNAIRFAYGLFNNVVNHDKYKVFVNCGNTTYEVSSKSLTKRCDKDYGF